MNLARLRAATDILDAHTRAHGQGQAARGLSAGRFHAVSNEAAAAPLALGAVAVDRVIEGGLACGGLHEVRCALARDIGAGAGFALGLAARALSHGRDGRRRIVWVNDPAARCDGGGLLPAGLAQYGLDPAAFTLIEPRDLKGAMWAADEAAGCAGLAVLVFQIRGNPARFDMTATRRLLLRARENGVLALTLRQSGEEEASAAATRWRVQPHTSQVDELDQRGVGAMRLLLTLERNRAGRTGQWPLAWNPQTGMFDHAASQPASRAAPPTHSRHRLQSSADRPGSPGALGQVLDHRQGFGRAS